MKQDDAEALLWLFGVIAVFASVAYFWGWMAALFTLGLYILGSLAIKAVLTWRFR